MGPESLNGASVAISVSESPDLPRLGMTEQHMRLAVAEIARCVIVAGGTLVYGGDLRPQGYTIYLMDQLHRYGRRDKPLLICLPWSAHRTMPLSAIKQSQDALGLFGQIQFLDVDGRPIDPASGRNEEAPSPFDDETQMRSLTSLRQYLTTVTKGRVFIGGRREGFQGRMPGVMEEALIAIRAKQPLYLAGGFGGVTLDIVRTLEADHARWLPDLPAVTVDARVKAGLDELAGIRNSADWQGFNNGLSDEENRRLAATHRPSDVAALVSLGLGRRLRG